MTHEVPKQRDQVCVPRGSDTIYLQYNHNLTPNVSIIMGIQ
jgi:hypothetical protein